MAEEKARDPTKSEVKPVNIPLSKIHDLPGSVFAPPSQKSLEALTSSIVLKGVQEPVILRQRRRRRNRKKSRKRFRIWKMRMQTVKNRIYLRNRLKSQLR